LSIARSGLEEIDLIMAKAYTEKESPVTVAEKMPRKEADEARGELEDVVENGEGGSGGGDDREASERDALLPKRR
jgi:hypothetical protein